MKISIEKYSIYIHRNRANNKIYVGYTNDIDRRWREIQSTAFNKKYPSYNFAISRAIRKYGWDNFTHKVIQIFGDEEQAKKAECFWISYFKTYTKIHGSKYGYNMTPGGDCQAAVDLSPEAKEKRSKAHRKFTKEQYEDMITQYQSGISCKDIMNIYHCCKSVLLDAIIRAGLPRIGRQLAGIRSRTKLELKIINLYQQNITIKNIVSQLNCRRTTIFKVLKRNNIKLKGKNIAASENDIISLYNKGIIWQKMSKQLGVSTTTIKKVLERNNIPHRGKK